jgi:hypothetical protein
MHMVFQTADQQIAVIGVFVDLDNGAAAPAAPVAETPAAPAAEKLRFRMRGAKRQEPAPVEGALGGGQKAFLTTPMITSPGISSSVLETVFSKVGEIATPGTSTKTAPLAMSEIVTTILSGSFQSYSGSLTTPPCSEGVRWLVATQKLQIQTATFESVRSVIGFNARYPQNTPGQPNVLQLAAAAGGAQVPVAA